MGVLVIVCYRPKAGKEQDLVAAIKDHLPVLRAEGLATDREAYVAKAKNGTYVEIFEWKSQKAIDAAHDNAAVMKLWERFGACCDYEMIGNVPEAKQLFSPFEPVQI
jgi:quinol monooxygenase YgiN